MLDLARKGLDQVISMINAVLDVSKIEAGELRPIRRECNLVSVVRDAASILEPLLGQRNVELECSSESIPALIDRDMISRVIQNLLGNAIKFTEPTGRVQLQIRRNGGGTRVSVVDNGLGIPAEYHQRIFQKFGQVESGRDRVGTGIGLTFCRLAIEAHGGTLGVISEPGKGSSFWFELPDEALVAL
jgi:signal transduction histidine kinase